MVTPTVNGCVVVNARAAMSDAAIANIRRQVEARLPGFQTLFTEGDCTASVVFAPPPSPARVWPAWTLLFAAFTIGVGVTALAFSAIL